MKNRGIERIRKRLGTSVMVAMMLLLSISMLTMGANQRHWGFGDGEDLPINITGEDRGISYFVDGMSGNDANNGLTWATAKRTIQAAVNVATMGNGDYIYVKGVEYPEDVTVNKSNIHIIGEGQYLVNVRSFNVVVASVEITGFYIYGSTGVTSIASSNQYLYLHENTIVIPESGVGLSLTNHYAEVFSNDFRSNSIGTTAIEISGSAKENHIYDNEFVGFTTGIRLNTAGFRNFIYNNRFIGAASVYPATGITGIVISSGNDNMISQNWIGYCEIPIMDRGTANAWLDNHWDGWEGEWTIRDTDDINEVTVASNIDIPSEGKVSVRFRVDPTNPLMVGRTLTVRMRDPTTNALLTNAATYAVGGVFPTVEATLDGGNDQMTLTISIFPGLPGGQSLSGTYEILDA